LGSWVSGQGEEALMNSGGIGEGDFESVSGVAGSEWDISISQRVVSKNSGLSSPFIHPCFQSVTWICTDFVCTNFHLYGFRLYGFSSVRISFVRIFICTDLSRYGRICHGVDFDLTSSAESRYEIRVALRDVRYGFCTDFHLYGFVALRSDLSRCGFRFDQFR
jgi:hypothetical protein